MDQEMFAVATGTTIYNQTGTLVRGPWFPLSSSCTNDFAGSKNETQPPHGKLSLMSFM